MLARFLVVGWLAAGLILAIRAGLVLPAPKAGHEVMLATLVVLLVASLLRNALARLQPERPAWARVLPTAGSAFFAYWLVHHAGAMSVASLTVFLVAVHEFSWLLMSGMHSTPSATDREQTATEPDRSPLPPEDCDIVLQRGRLDNVEYIRGTARLVFEGDQRTASTAIGFTPPLVPDCVIEAEPAGGPDVSLRILEPSPTGFIVEARRRGKIADAATATIEFVATAEEAGLASPRLRAV